MLFGNKTCCVTCSWFVFASVLLGANFGESAPSFIEPCRLGDDECLKASFQKALPGFIAGIPDLGVEVLDPMHLDTLDYELAGLKFKLEDGRIKGWKSVVVDKVVWSTEKKTIDLEFHSGFLLRGTYTAGGQLLILPISGHGDMKLKTKDMRFKMHVPYEIVKGANGEDHLHLKEYKFSFEETAGAQYTLTNLFGGNKDLGNAMHQFLNENWRVVTNDFGGPVIEAAVKKLFKNVQTFMSKVPLEELTVQ